MAGWLSTVIGADLSLGVDKFLQRGAPGGLVQDWSTTAWLALKIFKGSTNHEHKYHYKTVTPHSEQQRTTYVFTIVCNEWARFESRTRRWATFVGGTHGVGAASNIDGSCIPVIGKVRTVDSKIIRRT